MKIPTKRQQDIYEFVQEFITLRKYPPTIREIGDRFGIASTNGVRDALKALERKGLIRKFSNQARGIEVIKDSGAGTSQKHFLQEHSLPLPVIGRIAAGTPILAEQNIEDTMVIDKSLFPRSSQIFALKVYGDSMIGDGILDGDIAIIRMQKSAERGQIVAAVIDGNATLKHYHPGYGKVELRASNANYIPITVSSGEDFFIAGILAGVIRKY